VNATDFQVPNGDRNVGTLYLPDSNDGACPVMILCHGWAGDRQHGAFRQALCSTLTDRGMAVVSFDFFGCGDTGGEYTDMTYGRWARNLADVHTWAAQQPWADSTRIGCLGISSRSTAALRFAHQAADCAFAISVATCLGLYISMPNSPARSYVQETEELLGGGQAPVFGMLFPLAFFRDFVEHAPIYDVHEIACPVLFLQGSEDNPFRRSDAWLGYQLRHRAGTPVEYVEVEGGDHGLGARAEESTAIVVSWLQGIHVLPRP
jgi:uncharacterized protein